MYSAGEMLYVTLRNQHNKITKTQHHTKYYTKIHQQHQLAIPTIFHKPSSIIDVIFCIILNILYVCSFF